MSVMRYVLQLGKVSYSAIVGVTILVGSYYFPEHVLIMSTIFLFSLVVEE